MKTEANNQALMSAIPLFSLEPADRAWLHARIAERFDKMLAAGLLDEVQSLRTRGDLDAHSPSMRCVGYRQAWAVLAGEAPMSELRDRGVAATRQLAKRQLTWLRSTMPQRHVVACDEVGATRQLLAAVDKAVARQAHASKQPPPRDETT